MVASAANLLNALGLGRVTQQPAKSIAASLTIPICYCVVSKQNETQAKNPGLAQQADVSKEVADPG